MRLSDLDSMEFEFKVEDADLSKLAELLADVNIKETPWFDVSDKHGNSARYYREGQWIPCSERLPELYKPVLVTGGDIIWICELIESPDLDDGEFQWEDKMLGHWYSFDNWDAWCPLPEPWKEQKE